MSAPPPLPVRDGVGPTRLRVPATGPWAGIPGFLVARFDHLDPGELHRRIEAGEIVGADGRAIAHDTPLGAHEFVWYHRDLPDETVLPFREEILYRDDHLVVVDKPHFLPTTPSGRFLRETALVRLRTRLGNDALTPIHRLDRETAGLVMFSARPDTRGAYQSMFERREVAKVYEAVSARPRGWDPRDPTIGGRPLPIIHRAHIRSRRGDLRVTVDPSLPTNSETHIDVLAAGPGVPGRQVLHTILRPRTGRPHQLRVHLAALGIPILGDRRYPDLLPESPDDPDLPLQLLASALEFTDPVTGAPRRFVTRRTLRHAPVSGRAGNPGG